jgi:hypothetical protein
MGSLTFRWPVFVAFRTNDENPLVVTNKGRIFVAQPNIRAGGVRARMMTTLDLTSYGIITAVVSSGSALHIATESGAILLFDGDGISEVARAKNPIVRLIRCPMQSIVAIDDKHMAYFLAFEHDFAQLPVPVKNAVMCAPLAFLVRSPGQHVITPIRMAGKYKPVISDSFLKMPVMKSGPLSFGRLPDRPTKRTDMLDRYGLPLLVQLQHQNIHPNWTSEQLRVLQYVLRSGEVNTRSALRISLFLNDFRGAQAILRMPDPKSPAFALNRYKLALFGTDRLTAAVETAVADLTDAGMIEDAIDLLLITGNWEAAIGRQVEAKDLVGAMLTARARPAGEDRSAAMRELAEEAAGDGNFACAMQLLAECGDAAGIAAEFEMGGETEQAKIVGALLSAHL